LRGPVSSRTALLFRLGVMRRGHAAQLKAGEYAFPLCQRAQVMDMLIAHRVVGHRITIAEGLTSDAAVAHRESRSGPDRRCAGCAGRKLLPKPTFSNAARHDAELLQGMHQAQRSCLPSYGEAKRRLLTA